MIIKKIKVNSIHDIKKYFSEREKIFKKSVLSDINIFKKIYRNEKIMMHKIAVVGGGVSGATTAIELKKAGNEVYLFEKNSGLLTGPPACHLHAGGNLYPEISMEDAKKLLKESLEFTRRFPLAINHRPTLFAVPIWDNTSVEKLIKKALELQEYYQFLCSDDKSYRQLGDASSYVSIFHRQDIEKMKKNPSTSMQSIHEEFMCRVCNYLELDKLKWPILMISEPGISLFRMAAILEAELKKFEVTTYFNQRVTFLKEGNQFIVNGSEITLKVDKVVNATGYEIGELATGIGIKKTMYAELKSAYIAHWPLGEGFPEIIIHGVRGTQKGMGQFTPNEGGYIQLHAMIPESTLFPNNIAKSNEVGKINFRMELDRLILNLFPCEEFKDRTQSAIDYLTAIIPSFSTAKIYPKALWGIQRIESNDLSKRVADAYISENYAEISVVKYSSILTQIQQLMLMWHYDLSKLSNELFLERNDILKCAEKIAVERGFPKEIAAYYMKS